MRITIAVSICPPGSDYYILYSFSVRASVGSWYFYCRGLVGKTYLLLTVILFCFVFQQSRPIQSRFLQSRNLNCIALCEGNNMHKYNVLKLKMKIYFSNVSFDLYIVVSVCLCTHLNKNIKCNFLFTTTNNNQFTDIFSECKLYPI